MSHTCNPSTCEAKVRGLQVPEQPQPFLKNPPRLKQEDPGGVQFWNQAGAGPITDVLLTSSIVPFSKTQFPVLKTGRRDKLLNQRLQDTVGSH